MSEPTQGSETTEEIITTPEEAIKAGEDGPSEEKETPAASSADTPEEIPEEEKPADEAEEADEEPEEEKAKEGEPDAAKADNGEPGDGEGSEGTEVEDGDESTDLSDGAGKNAEENLKRAPGETAKEYALRREVTRLKRVNRTQRITKLLGDVQPQKAVAPADLSDEEKKVLESFDPEQLSNQEKLFGILAKKNGYVRKDELSQSTYKETAQTVLDDWMEKHPEYSEDKDPDGILWKRFGQEFGMYKAPANPKDHTKIFNRIHNDIFGITTKEKASKDLKTAAAQQQKLKTAGAGNGGSAPRKLSDRRIASPADKELSQVARSGGLKGFSDQEIAELGL